MKLTIIFFFFFSFFLIGIFWQGRGKNQSCWSVLCNFVFSFFRWKSVDPILFHRLVSQLLASSLLLQSSTTLIWSLLCATTFSYFSLWNLFQVDFIHFQLIDCFQLQPDCSCDCVLFTHSMKGENSFCLGEIKGDHVAWTAFIPRTGTSLGKLADMWNITFFTHLYFFFCHFNTLPPKTIYQGYTLYTTILRCG